VEGLVRSERLDEDYELNEKTLRYEAPRLGKSLGLGDKVRVRIDSVSVPQRRIELSLLGAESTGKSSLTVALAEEFGTTFVPEVGRDVWQEKHGELTLDDYVDIATRHRGLEDAALLDANRYVFVDTNALTTMLLCYAYEGRGLPELTDLARSAEHRYAHTFLCSDDIPFEQDGWRDDEMWRTRAQGLVRFDLASRGITYTEIGGSITERVQLVRSALADPSSSRDVSRESAEAQ
jgi:NadR type nicotinamide-nucleotide adenylyltransferase